MEIFLCSLHGSFLILPTLCTAKTCKWKGFTGLSTHLPLALLIKFDALELKANKVKSS